MKDNMSLGYMLGYMDKEANFVTRIAGKAFKGPSMLPAVINKADNMLPAAINKADDMLPAVMKPLKGPMKNITPPASSLSSGYAGATKTPGALKGVGDYMRANKGKLGLGAAGLAAGATGYAAGGGLSSQPQGFAAIGDWIKKNPGSSMGIAALLALLMGKAIL